ncbi:MAG: hypothetical protein MJ079_04400 [Ruminococcus sp.]|nr:hypothetical protein [Ruminococcus sp.]
MRPPKKPTPSQSGIIVETETTSAETTFAPTSPSATALTTTTIKHMTSATTTATYASTQQTVTSVRTTTSASRMNVVSTTTIAVTSPVTNSTAASTSTVVVPLTTTAVTSLSPIVTTIATMISNNDYVYICDVAEGSVYVQTGVEAEESQLGERIKDCVISKGDTVWGTNSSSAFYALNDVSPKAIIAVKLDGEQPCNVYLNTGYEPETLGDMLDDLRLDEYMNFGSQNIRVPSEQAYCDVPSERIMTVLDECRDAVNTPSLNSISRDLIIFSDITYMRYNTSFFISKEGYIATNITNRGVSFYIGEDKAQRCIEYLLGK